MLNYYLNLPDMKDNMDKSFAIMKVSRRSFNPFEQYLRNVIKAMEKKEISAKWEKVKIKNIAELKIIGGLYEVKKNQQKLRLNEIAEIKVGDVIRGSFDDHNVISVNEKVVVLEPVVEKTEDLFFNKQKLLFSIEKSENVAGEIIQENDERFVVYLKEKNNNLKEIKQISSFIDFDDIKFEHGQKLSAERNENLTFYLDNENDFGKIVVSNKIKFRLENVKKNNKEAWMIQLSEIEDDKSNDEISGLSPLRYFFDDDISVVDEKDGKTEYQVDFSSESEYKMVLKQRNGKYWEYCHPKSDIIKVKVNTYQLKKQIEAINTLRDMPIDEHSLLIKLFEDRDKTHWRKPQDENVVEEWFVISDNNRSGIEEQRQFVNKALNTPDFAILEGPPGSGKTTVILELICQLVKQNKRVLLCGSTHIAIDNILERLKETRNGSSLLKEFQILPIRIGDQNRINEDIREFQINNLMKENNIDENSVELLLDSANLVCGTTIGILQHPKFKKRKGKLIEQLKYFSNTPIVPEFDYLIIDESSKTTFQEFLVPALYAKKWVLVGDVMQLSPYTDRDEVVSNIEELHIDGEPLDKNLQKAVFYLHKLKNLLHGKNNRFVFPVEAECIKPIRQELDAGRKEKLYIEIVDTPKDCDNFNTLKATASNVIFVNKTILSEILPKLPETHAMLRLGNSWLETQHAFSHNYYSEKNKFSYKEKGKDFSDSFKIAEHINKYFLEKNWAEEIAWRIDREHQQRLVVKKKARGKSYAEQIDELVPRSIINEKVVNAINEIAVMAFPSILESLVSGIKGRKTWVESTISEGFREEDLKKRKTTLEYQHRMHPEISAFPRSRFYKNTALKDLENPNPIEQMRNWEYKKYPARNFWVDVQKSTTYRNKNQQEVDCLMQHLKKFVEWAKNNPHPENKEWSVACLTFYRGQEKLIREKIQAYTHKENGISNFDIKDGQTKVNIKLHTVDKFQGHEADIVFLSMVQTRRVGFMDNPNRLNVAITRAKFQLVIIGDQKYFSEQNDSEELKLLAQNTKNTEVYK